jgi:antitoxin VapB
MNTAKIFNNGRSQAVRLPKEYRFDSDEVVINKIGDVVVLSPKNSEWGPLLNASGKFTDDFMSDREQAASPDKRKKL